MGGCVQLTGLIEETYKGRRDHEMLNGFPHFRKYLNDYISRQSVGIVSWDREKCRLVYTCGHICPESRV